MTNEMKTVHMLLSECFPKGKMLTHMDPIEFVAHPRGNIYFILGNCQTKLEVDCKVLEYFSRAAYKTEPYYTKVNNDIFHEYFLNGINRYFGSSFTKEDIEVVYTHLGNCCNRQKTIEFIKSGFDMSVLDPSLNKDDPRIKQNEKLDTIAKILEKNSCDEVEVVVDEPCMQGDMEQEVDYEV